MKTINLLGLANATVGKVTETGITITAGNGIKIHIKPIQWVGVQVWLSEIDKQSLPRRLVVGDTLFTLDNCDNVKTELYDVQYQAALNTLLLKESKDVHFTPAEYIGDQYLQFNDTPFALRIKDSVAELVFAVGVAGTPAMLEVSNNPLQDFATAFDTMLNGMKLGSVTVVIRRIPVLNAQVDVLPLAKSLVLHPEATIEDIRAEEIFDTFVKQMEQREALKPYYSFISAIFECAESMMVPTTVEAPAK